AADSRHRRGARRPGDREQGSRKVHARGCAGGSDDPAVVLPGRRGTDPLPSDPQPGAPARPPVIDQIARREHESLLASPIRPVAGELRLVDVGELVAAVRARRFAHLQAVTDPSPELYFRPGTLSF